MNAFCSVKKLYIQHFKNISYLPKNKANEDYLALLKILLKKFGAQY